MKNNQWGRRNLVRWLKNLYTENESYRGQKKSQKEPSPWEAENGQ